MMQLLQHKKHCCEASKQVSDQSTFKTAKQPSKLQTKCSCSEVVACVLEVVEIEVQVIDEVDVVEEVPFHQVVRPLGVDVKVQIKASSIEPSWL